MVEVDLPPTAGEEVVVQDGRAVALGDDLVQRKARSGDFNRRQSPIRVELSGQACQNRSGL